MNVSNKLTILRLLLIPFFIFFISCEFISYGYLLGLIIFIIASLTDFFDGYLARKRNIITDFGKLMDPLADKMLVISALVVFVAQGKIDDIAVIVIIFREFLVTSLRLLASNNGAVISADRWGKAKTVSQFIMILIILFYNSFQSLMSDNIRYCVFMIGSGFVSISVILTLISGINYLVKNKTVWRSK